MDRGTQPSFLFHVALSTEGEEAAYGDSPLYTTGGSQLQSGADAEGLRLTLILEQVHVCVQPIHAHA